MNVTILTYDILDSTNTEALKQARSGADEGLCIIARQQTAGRGRYGRTWVSECDAGLYFSIVLRPRLETEELSLITVMAGVAVHDTLVELGIDPDIKWVNDLLVNEKKIAGILAETTETNTGLAVVLGIGINVKTTNFPPDLVATATCIEDTSPNDVSREDLIAVLTRHLQHYYATLSDENGRTELLELWMARSSYSSGKLVRVQIGNESITGTTDGLELNGALRIRHGDGTFSIVQAGDVERVRAAI